MKNTFHSKSCSICLTRAKCVFKDVDKNILEEIDSKKIMTPYKKGAALFHQGTPVMGLHFLAAGKIKLSSICSEGKESIQSLSFPGEVYGHRNLFSEGCHTHTATTLEDSLICFVEKKNIQEIIEGYPQLYRELILRFSHEIEVLQSHEQSVLSKGARSRVAELLLSFSEDAEVLNSGQLKISVQLTRYEMASMVGLASETLIRLLSDFKLEKIIEQSGKSLIILDVEKLKKLAA